MRYINEMNTLNQVLVFILLLTIAWTWKQGKAKLEAKNAYRRALAEIPPETKTGPIRIDQLNPFEQSGAS